MPESVAHIKHGEHSGSIESCSNIFYCRERVMLTTDGLIEVSGVEAYAQVAILFGDHYRGAYPWGRLLN